MKTGTALLCLLPFTAGFSFVPQNKNGISNRASLKSITPAQTFRKSSSLKMVDQNIIQGGVVGALGFAAGLGILVFTENQGERAKARGGGLSDEQTTKITGMLMEDVEVSSVADVGSLAEQLEAALKETGSAEVDNLEMTEEEKQRIAEEADDGW
mmetsp:Transcript_20838/g.30843  ORF Transcript_20838/g.30843 Transcript_20838/m.30843 type:complete len:155 (+) Transcript_20838:66-530(+)|eukprot:CAMPEP_0194224252 /NCGR_PEP_ID=MMETSP0156-20130528/37000_1 /TAXON_ID=33649 /ORGANISM="Thalassionema nitzschioides, Strain L26-B" /LENGTH=154 /DNA_ID=CAMNT_0038955715 /DNA_START=73 /DNA_END=537 /DNA_ORIENTATION=-